MAKSNIEKAKALDWSEHTSTLPKEGVVYPKGQNRADLIARPANRLIPLLVGPRPLRTSASFQRSSQ